MPCCLRQPATSRDLPDAAGAFPRKFPAELINVSLYRHTFSLFLSLCIHTLVSLNFYLPVYSVYGYNMLRSRQASRLLGAFRPLSRPIQQARYASRESQQQVCTVYPPSNGY